ncbi:hypothetical protein GE09DRAFT_773523 [Coniochaeta sp. 2T2.1]|nr:hypothetical protein GE09DRAFT_773523 [Coniochaeta sp. 2T2.1]
MHGKPGLPNPAPASIATITSEDGEQLRILSRSPHPYHRNKSELLVPSDILVHKAATPVRNTSDATGLFSQESTPASESGTEADDEHFLKRLPAPKARLHKGLRGQNEPLSGTSTPLASPALCDQATATLIIPPRLRLDGSRRSKGEKIRRRKEIVRRSAEVLLLASLGGLVHANQDAQPFIKLYRKELAVGSQLFLALLAAYPVRLIIWAYRRGKPSRIIPIRVPSSFDPAPILYPQILPILLSLLVAANVPGVVLLNVLLSLITIPAPLIPTIGSYESLNPVHWLLSCVPLFLAGDALSHPTTTPVGVEAPGKEMLVLLYPLHQHLYSILQYLTTTSLLPAELQLLSVGLINTFLLAYSPQVVILKALLWIAGLGILILCGSVIRWGIILARVPKWRFNRSATPSKAFSVSRFLRSMLVLFTRPRRHHLGPGFEHLTAESCSSSDEEYGSILSPIVSNERARRRESITSGGDGTNGHAQFPDGGMPSSPQRRHTLPSLARSGPQSKTHTPSGRRKRSASSTVQSFFSLTRAQAAARRWLYAGYVYACILAITLIGVREYIKTNALSGNEPIGWALGYLLGDIPWFRFQVVKANLQRWILLPPRFEDVTEACYLGPIEHIRHAFLGAANTRIFLSGYFLAIIITGLAVVFRLSPVYEVDTRRKVFHFMMVAMFLPATFVDPTFAALGLSIVLAVFLLLDLLRASQLPPLSKPIANFLTPYVDGRDLRGPVVVSHIFLLIGCAIPLWLSLAALPRTGTDALAGWEVPTRDISMVSGVVCVGLGDAAASLIGRRWGRRKWLWGGGKSLEGSVAFALAVFVGLMAASVWLRIGGWPVSGHHPALEQAQAQSLADGGILGLWPSLLQGWGVTVQKTAACASMASLTEAVLTGGNDNVVVPVVLWACVKSTGI